MSMIGYLLRVTKPELDQYIEDSSLLEERAFLEEDIEDENLLDIDKTWEGILYLLTGYNLEQIGNASPPLSWAFLSGQIIDEELDMGYGPANYCMPDQVKMIADALKELPSETLKQRYNAAKMQELEIYPFDWLQDENGILEYVLEHYESMREFYAIAARNNQAVITYLN
jgi:hypothetical protein